MPLSMSELELTNWVIWSTHGIMTDGSHVGPAGQAMRTHSLDRFGQVGILASLQGAGSLSWLSQSWKLGLLPKMSVPPKTKPHPGVRSWVLM